MHSILKAKVRIRAALDELAMNTSESCARDIARGFYNYHWDEESQGFKLADKEGEDDEEKEADQRLSTWMADRFNRQT